MTVEHAIGFCIDHGEYSVALGTVWREGRESALGGLQRAVNCDLVGTAAVVAGLDAGLCRLMELRVLLTGKTTLEIE